jgi:LmbE family N-acetylglucosaminyl deacetylase
MPASFQSVLVVAAHPDDEALGCGGTLARLASRGANICVLLLGEGPTARSGGAEVKRGATTSALAAATVLGIRDVRFAALPDNRFDSVPLLDLCQKIEAVGREIDPDLVLTHHAGDLNIDHGLAARAALTAFRPLPGSKNRCVLGFEILSSTEYNPPGLGPAFQPNLYVDITDHLGAKQKALETYGSEMRPWPHPRSHEAVEHLARLRGSHCGCKAAEAFILYRTII